jgi:hypothetical protein
LVTFAVVALAVLTFAVVALAVLTFAVPNEMSRDWVAICPVERGSG